MKIITKLILCLGLVCSLNIFAACPDKTVCDKCATQCAGQADCPQKADCDTCASNECSEPS
jgi:hypothetical protein